MCLVNLNLFRESCLQFTKFINVFRMMYPLCWFNSKDKVGFLLKTIMALFLYSQLIHLLSCVFINSNIYHCTNMQSHLGVQTTTKSMKMPLLTR